MPVILSIIQAYYYLKRRPGCLTQIHGIKSSGYSAKTLYLNLIKTLCLITDLQEIPESKKHVKPQHENVISKMQTEGNSLRQITRLCVCFNK